MKKYVKPLQQLFILAIFVMFATDVGASDNGFSNDPSGVTHKMLTHFSDERFDEAVNQFFYPDEYSEEKLSKEVSSVKESLIKFYRQYGKPLRLKPHTHQGEVVSEGVSGITPEYLNKYQPFYTQMVSIDFEKKSDIISMINFIMKNDECLIQMFTLGVPKNTTPKHLFMKK